MKTTEAEIHNLVVYFLVSITESKGVPSFMERKFETAFEDIRSAIEDGWPLSHIQTCMAHFKETRYKEALNTYYVKDVLKHYEKPVNLIEPHVVYYHSELRDMSGATRMRRNPETGLFERKTEPFQIKMKENYSYNDVVAYFEKKTGIVDKHKERSLGQVKYLLQHNDIDELLFAIDVAVRDPYTKKNIKTVFDVEKYIMEARDVIKRKENEHKKKKLFDKIEW